MLLYLLLVAIANLGLGFALAVYLGRRYRAMSVAGGWSDLVLPALDDCLPAAGEDGYFDSLTGLANRAGVEAALATLWMSHGEPFGGLCLAIIEIDEFSEINLQFGYHVGNSVLGDLARHLESLGYGGGTLARLASQQFALLLLDLPMAEAASQVEAVRQSVEAARFGPDDVEVRATVTCCLTPALATDTPLTLLGRAEATLRDTEGQGRNRTLVHDGQAVSSLVPAAVSIDQVTDELPTAEGGVMLAAGAAI